MKQLTADNLMGIWSLVPTPWDDHGDLDIQVLRHDVAYLLGSGVDGLYTTASSGEFFALDDAEFRLLVETVLDEAGKVDVPVQIGCAATDTRRFLYRAEHAVSLGASAIQVILPYYIQLELEEAFTFFEDVARVCSNVPLVHYNTGHAKRTFEVADYLALQDRVPTLIGTKLPRDEPLWFTEICRCVSQMSHFCAEYAFVANFVGGARGMYSWLAVTNPRLALVWYYACRNGDFTEAIRIQKLVNRFKLEVKTTWRGQSDAAVNKTDAMLNPNMRCGLGVRAPYLSNSQDELDSARNWAEQHFPELLIL